MLKLARNADASKDTVSSIEISKKKIEELLIASNATNNAALTTGKKIATSGAVIIKATYKLIKIAPKNVALIFLKKKLFTNKTDVLLKNKPSLHGLNQKQCKQNLRALLNIDNGLMTIPIAHITLTMSSHCKVISSAAFMCHGI